MLNKYEGKTKEQALEKAMIELNCEEDNLIYDYEYVEGKLFKSSKYIIKVVEKNKIKEFINDYLNNLSNLMNIKIENEILESDNIYNVTLITSNNAILIGKEGKNLNSLQSILRNTIKNQTELNIKINIDISNYKNKKMKNLEFEVKKIAREVLKTKLSVSLDPMNSYERRFIHNLINTYDHLETESVGEGKERHIIIKYI